MTIYLSTSKSISFITARLGKDILSNVGFYLHLHPTLNVLRPWFYSKALPSSNEWIQLELFFPIRSQMFSFYEIISSFCVVFFFQIKINSLAHNTRNNGNTLFPRGISCLILTKLKHFLNDRRTDEHLFTIPFLYLFYSVQFQIFSRET